MKTKPIEELTRYLGNVSPTLETRGLSQSRRVEGQFSEEGEVRCFREVHLWAGVGLDLESPSVKRVCHEIAGFQRSRGRGEYRVHYHYVESWSKPLALKTLRVTKGDKTTGAGLLRPLVDLAAGEVSSEFQDRCPASRKARRDDLVVFFLASEREIPSAELVEVADFAHADRCLWVFLNEGTFLPEKSFRLQRSQPSPRKEIPMLDSQSVGVIHGYSERGVVNALFEPLVAAHDKALFEDFLHLMVHWKEGTETPVPDFDSYEVYIEPSLSDFGEPDVLIFLKKEEQDVAVYFVEAKVEFFLHSSPPIEVKSRAFYQENASSVMHELFLKANLVGALNYPEGWLPGDLVEGVEDVYADDGSMVRLSVQGVYKRDKKKIRKIGEDPLVLELARRLHRFVTPKGKGGREPYYVSLTTDPDIRQEEAVMKLVADVVDANVIPDQLKFHEPLKETLQKRLLLLSWQRIFAFVSRHESLARTRQQLLRNIPKFVFPPMEAKEEVGPLCKTLSEVIRNFEQTLGDNPGTPGFFKEKELPEPREDGTFTVYLGKAALFTVSASEGLDGPLLRLYIVQKAVKKALHAKEITRLHERLWPDKIWVRASELAEALENGQESAAIREVREVVKHHCLWLAKKNNRSSTAEKS